jgi:hypothetical protein
MDDGLHTPGPEGFRDETRGSVLLMAPLRDRMQPLAQFESSRKFLFQGIEELPEEVSRHAGTARRPLADPHLRGGRSRSA